MIFIFAGVLFVFFFLLLSYSHNSSIRGVC